MEIIAMNITIIAIAGIWYFLSRIIMSKMGISKCGKNGCNLEPIPIKIETNNNNNIRRTR